MQLTIKLVSETKSKQFTNAVQGLSLLEVIGVYFLSLPGKVSRESWLLLIGKTLEMHRLLCSTGFNLDIWSVSVCGMFGLQSAMFANIRTSAFCNSKTTSATTTAFSVNGYHCLLVTSAFRGHLQAFLSLPMSNRSPIPMDFTSIILFLMFTYF